jgi:hypothetical protein
MRTLTVGLAAAALVVTTGFASAQTSQQRPSDPGMTNTPQAGTSGTNPTDPGSVKKSGTTSGMSSGKTVKKSSGMHNNSSGGQGGGEGGSGR